MQREDIESSKYALYFNNRQIAEYADYMMLADIAGSPSRKKVATELMEGKLSVIQSFFLVTNKSPT